MIFDCRENETIDFMIWTGIIKTLPHKLFSKRENSNPVTFEDMKRVVAILSKGMPFLYVDFYEVNEKCILASLHFIRHRALESLSWKLGIKCSEI